jgi:hypoxanthine phosphoribosyltransferase
MAAEISRDYAGRKVLCVGLLTGCFVFLADLLRHFLVPYEVDFMVVSSYGHSTVSSGSVKLKKDMSIDPRGRDVLIIEDLIDTGTTLAWIVAHLKSKGCESVRLACLLDKACRRTANVHVDYVGFTCPDGQLTRGICVQRAMPQPLKLIFSCSVGCFVRVLDRVRRGLRNGLRGAGEF